MDLWTDIYHPAIKIATPSRPSSRASTIKSSPASPSYTSPNPFIYSTSAHSLTHPCSTHHLAACARCNPSRMSRTERSVMPLDEHRPSYDKVCDHVYDHIYDNSGHTGLTKSTRASRLLQQWGTFKT